MSILKNILLFLAMCLITVGLLFGISAVQDNMQELVTEHKLMDTNIIDDAPPVVAFTTIALGSFRGLLVDYLWLRADKQQEEGQYFELRQLASWIVQLQPRFTGATTHLAWNMAYNISVMFSYPDERWRWVQNGIELIRDEALVYNPAAPKLYKELGWIYQHKIGNIMDDANLYYKMKLAQEMETVAGGANPNWAKLATIPVDIKDFEEKYLDGKSLEELILKSSNVTFKEFEHKFREGSISKENLDDYFGDKSKIVEDFLRVRWLRFVLKLDPVIINKINKKYGKLDWRLPEAHAIYWATQGLMHSRNGRDVSCQRMITQCLAVSFTAGRMLSIPQKKGGLPFVLTLPNLSVADSVKHEFEKAYKETGTTTFLNGRKNFMVSAITQFYVYGRYSKAQEYLDILRKEFPNDKRYSLNLDKFIRLEKRDMVKNATPKEAGSLIAGQIYQSCLLLAFGEREAAVSFEKTAKFIYNYYTLQHKDTIGRVGLMNYKRLKSKIINNCIKVFPKELSDNLKFAIESINQEVQ